jgi:nucleoside-diphosphate-sugar epimerase
MYSATGLRSRAVDARRRTLLLTGAAGLIGTILRNGLEDRYAIRALDLTAASGIAAVDMTDLVAADPFFVGVDTVIDLAAETGPGVSWATVCKNNLLVTANSLEASRRAGVRRVVFMSSNHVTGLYEREQPYAAILAGDYDGLHPEDIPRLSARSAVRPDGPYAVGKLAGEAAARYYSDVFGLSTICLRIGTVNRRDRPEDKRHYATLLTHADLVRLVECAIEAPETVRHGVFYGVSDNTWRIWEIEDARELLGYVPRDKVAAPAR